MSEVYHTLQKEHEFKEQNTWERTNLDEVYENYKENENENHLFWVHGFGGTGKSYMVKRWMEEKSKENRTAFFAYLDLSDCGDESDVYYRIACELKKYYKTHHSFDDKKNSVDTVIKMYEWVKGIYHEDFSYAKSIENVTDKVVALVNNEIKNANNEIKNANNEIEVKSKFDKIVSEILLKLADMIPFVKNLKWIIETLIDVKDISNGIKLKKSLLNVISKLESSVLREQYLLDNLKSAMPQNAKTVIILDNFQLNIGNELGRNHQWLSQAGKLFEGVTAFWIITSRRYEEGLFQNIFEEHIKSYEVHGFSQKMAEDYLNANCFDENNQQPQEELIRAMLEACYYGDEDNNERVYLPYLLRLIVLYYWSIKEDAAKQIKPELFVKLEGQDSFVGYYFYKDLSDLMINAFQILSCLSVWDDVWIDKVREKFDNHLLNAKYLLRKKASIEDLSGGSFKLHEALKEALYCNQQNYIKQDVLEFLYQSFIEIYDKTWDPQTNLIWSDLNRIQTYIEIVFEYIELQEKSEREKKVWEIKNAIANIYAANKERGTVSQRFIYIYSMYIDELNKQLELSFNNISQRTFDDADKPLHKDEVCGDKSKIILYYISCCFQLADLYTNLDGYKNAKVIEKLCLEFWEEQKELAEGEEEWYYQCWQQKIKALNAIAYDSSAMHEYNEAFTKGTLGLYELYKLGSELCNIIENDERKSQIQILFRDQILENVDCESEFLEKKKGVLSNLVNAYKNLQRLHEGNKTNSYITILYELIFQILNNLRGNYPWYCLHASEFQLPDEIGGENIHYWQEVAKNPCSFGIYTYWMRQAIYEVMKDKKSNEVNNANKRMLTSYHNACVYLFKSDKVETACFLEREVLSEMKRLVGEDKLNKNAEMFLAKQEKGEIDEFPEWLWKQQNLNNESGKKFFAQYSQIIEAMQYLGDYYLALKLYSYAYKYLRQAMLYRLVVLGKTDTKTLDTTIRLLIASYGTENLKGEVATYIENLLTEQEVQGEGFVYVPKEVGNKMELLKELKDKADNNGKVEDMLNILKENEKKPYQNI